ncbi:hypothetical protein, partial [Streptomyces virginiae]|uniref:hypothetical protein n=1 Tax=Streptomyces virginiae TaxID=1961 RepID=UPI0034463B53
MQWMLIISPLGRKTCCPDRSDSETAERSRSESSAVLVLRDVEDVHDADVLSVEEACETTPAAVRPPGS